MIPHNPAGLDVSNPLSSFTFIEGNFHDQFPHLDCTLHNYRAAIHSTFLSEYPGIIFHSATLWCHYTALFVVYVITPEGWLYVMPSALNGIVLWMNKGKILVMSPFFMKAYVNSVDMLFVFLFIILIFQTEQILSIMTNKIKKKCAKIMFRNSQMRHQVVWNIV